jgi:ribosome-associated heat shock protein Hsp15
MSDHGKNAATPGGPSAVRLDKWLWAARFYKTRALAAEAIDGGKVDVNGDRAKRARQLVPGDRISMRLGQYEWHVIVRALSERRGPAVVAQTLYEETKESIAARAALKVQLDSMPSFFSHGDGKPSKQDRRALRRLKGDR